MQAVRDEHHHRRVKSTSGQPRLESSPGMCNARSLRDDGRNTRQALHITQARPELRTSRPNTKTKRPDRHGRHGRRSHCSITTVHCSANTAILLATKLAGDEAAKDPNIVSDAIGELRNMVAGNFKFKISSLSDHCMLSVSTVITGQNDALQSAEPGESLQVAVLFESSPIHISLTTQSQPRAAIFNPKTRMYDRRAWAWPSFHGTTGSIAPPVFPCPDHAFRSREAAQKTTGIVAAQDANPRSKHSRFDPTVVPVFGVHPRRSRPAA